METYSDTWHITPVNDYIEHEESGDDCVCHPTASPVKREDGSVAWIMMHHSLDGRELRERGQTIPVERHR